jgi:hypothetical protein
MTARGDTTEWDVAVGTGLVRLAAGAALLRWRRPLVRLTGASDDDRVVMTMFRYFGLRDIALGVAALAASRPGGDVRRQLVVQGLADTTDAGLVAAAVAAGHFPRWRGNGAVALAAGTAISEYAGAWWLSRRQLG